MKKLFLSIAACIIMYTLVAQTNSIKLIVRGDDMGYAHSGNEAIIQCYKNGIESSVEVLVPSPWFPEAVKMLNENLDVDVGIHLTLTSEWDYEKWRPLTDCKSLKDSDGYFYPMIWTNKNYPGKNLLAHNWKLADIEKEWRAQIELGLEKIPRISHISGHMGCTNINDSVYSLVRRLAKKYHIDIEPKDFNVTDVSYEGSHATSQEKITSFIAMLQKLETGKTYLFVDHPGLNTPELQAIHHIGYENVAEDRQGVTDVFTNEKVKQMIKEKGIVLIGYKDLKR
jgi:hypothetical protein